MFNKFLLIPVFLFAISGCSSDSPEELDRLMKEDAGFRQMIESRDQAHAQVRLIKDDLLLKKKGLDAQVEKMRQEYDNTAKAQNKKIEQYQGLIDGNRKNLKEQIESMTTELEAKQKELNGYEETLSGVKKVVRQPKGIRLTAQERQKWEERILMLTEKIRPLSEEIQELKLQIRLKKKKSHFLH